MAGPLLHPATPVVLVNTPQRSLQQWDGVTLKLASGDTCTARHFSGKAHWQREVANAQAHNLRLRRSFAAAEFQSRGCNAGQAQQSSGVDAHKNLAAVAFEHDAQQGLPGVVKRTKLDIVHLGNAYRLLDKVRAAANQARAYLYGVFGCHHESARPSVNRQPHLDAPVASAEQRALRGCEGSHSNSPSLVLASISVAEAGERATLPVGGSL